MGTWGTGVCGGAGGSTGGEQEEIILGSMACKCWKVKNALK